MHTNGLSNEKQLRSNPAKLNTLIICRSVDTAHQLPPMHTHSALYNCILKIKLPHFQAIDNAIHPFHEKS